MQRLSWAALALALAPFHVLAHVRLDPVADELVPPVRFEAAPPRWKLAGGSRGAPPPLPGLAPGFLSPGGGPQPRGGAPPSFQAPPGRILAEGVQGVQSGQVFDAAQQATIQVEDAALRIANERLRRGEAALRQEADRLRQQDEELRREDLELRREDSRLRRMVEKLLPGGNGAAALTQGSRALKHVTLGVCLGGCSLAVFGVLLCLYTDSYADAPGASFSEDADEADAVDEQELNAFLAPQPRRHSSCCCCLCGCLSFNMCVFLCGVLLLSILGSLVLWKDGVLQPLVGQLAMYVYGCLVIIGFISMMIWETKRLARAFTRYIVNEFRKIKHAFKAPWSGVHEYGGQRRSKGLLDEGTYAAFFRGGAKAPGAGH